MSSDASKIHRPTADASGHIAFENERKEDAIMRHTLEDFFTRWGPHNDEYNSQWQADLHMLVQRIYQAAQAPFLKAIGDAVARTPMPPFYVSKTEK